MSALLAPGEPLPAFTVTDQHGRPFSSSRLAGTWTVLWWFPAAFTPG